MGNLRIEESDEINRNQQIYRELNDILQTETNRDIQHNRRQLLGRLFYLSELVFREIKNNFLVYVLCIVYLSTCVLNKVFLKRTMQKMSNYSFVLSQTHNTVCSIAFYLVYFLMKYWNKDLKGSDKLPFLSYLTIAVLDALTVIISLIGLIKTTGNIQSFILQLSIPVNMFFCFFILNYKYHICNYIGASLIVLVIAIVEIKMSYETEEENSILFNFIYIAALIPTSFSNMTRETIFKKYKTNVPKLMAGVAVLQIFTTFLVLPVYTLPILKQAQINLYDIGPIIKHGLECLFLGKNTIVDNCGYNMTRLCDDCENAWKTFTVFSFFSVCDNLISCYIIDKFSTMTYTIVNCIQGPAITIAYYFKFVAGDVVRKPRMLDFVTLIGYFIGSIIYRTGNIILERKEEERKQLQEDNMNIHLINKTDVDSK